MTAVETSKEQPSGSFFNSVTLIAGTTIGAGILALPAVTLPAGLLPSTLLMVAVWLYMAASGLLIAEANLHAMQQLGRPEVGLLATIQFQLGKAGAIASGLLFAFIHYALLVAYAARGGDILAEATGHVASLLGIVPGIPLWWGHIAFVVLLGGLIFWSKEQFVSQLNSGLLVIVIVSFFGLLGLTFPQTEAARWVPQHWEAVGAAVPIMFVAFVYHSVVPVVTTRLQSDRKQIRQAILLGSLIPLVMFLLWNAVILGSVPLPNVEGGVIDPIELLRSGVDGEGLGVAVSVFSEFAIATSFIGFIYGLVSLFSDVLSAPVSEGLPLEKGHSQGDRASCATHATVKTAQPQDGHLSTIQRVIIYSLVLIPPTLLSLLSPNIFFDAIDLSGAFGVSILFGIIPAAMTWKQRYNSPIETTPMVGGGKATLTLMIAIAVGVLLQHVFTKAGVL